MRFRGLYRLLSWRQHVVGTRDEKILCDTLGVDGLPWDAVPPMYEFQLRRFRKLTHTDRRIVCRNFLFWLSNTTPKTRRRRP